MPKTFKQLCEEAADRALPTVEGQRVERQLFEANVSVLKKLLSPNTPIQERPNLNMSEALGSADASILFKTAVDDILLRPAGVDAIASTRLARTLNVDARSFTFPTMGGITAGEVSEAGDYPEATPGFGEMALEVRVKKYGLVIPINEDVINDSQWDIVALFLEQGRNAMIAKKEELCFNAFAQHASVVYDNAYPSGDATTKIAAQTRGTDTAGVFNGSISFKDFVVMLGTLVSNGYNPTDFTVHPLAWSVFINDPIMRFVMLQNGQVAQTIASLGPDQIGANIPWAFQTNVTKYVGYNGASTFDIFGSTAATTGISAARAVTDMYLSDRENSLVILQKEALAIEQSDDPYRDIMRMKLKERYGVGVVENGLGVVAAKNVVIAENDEAIYTVRTRTA